MRRVALGIFLTRSRAGYPSKLGIKTGVGQQSEMLPHPSLIFHQLLRGDTKTPNHKITRQIIQQVKHLIHSIRSIRVDP